MTLLSAISLSPWRIRLFRASLLGALLLVAAIAQASLPPFVPDESTRRWIVTETGLRYHAISFFLVMLLLSAVAIRWLWNRLRVDFPKLPPISYLRSLAIVVCWGLLFLVVLTMIAATRETMTPGVWEKQGLLYRVPEQSHQGAPVQPLHQ